MASDNPIVSIGIPVYNSEKFISDTLNSIVSQSYKELEIIISDNASTDATSEICKSYSERDIRIKYVRQEYNLGSDLNFKYVFDVAKGEFFMWHAAHHLRSHDYVEKNIIFLKNNPLYVASGSPDCFKDEINDPSKLAFFSFDGNCYNNLKCFLNNCWRSHGIFYSLIRKTTIGSTELIGWKCIAQDWILIIYLLLKGKIHRVQEGRLLLGREGQSNSNVPFDGLINKKIEHFFPLYEFTLYFIKSISFENEIGVVEKINLYSIIFWLNIKYKIREGINVILRAAQITANNLFMRKDKV